jgi:hypothetical protein
MSDSGDDLPRELARGRSPATPWIVLGSVWLTIAAVVAVVTAVLLLLWIFV